MLESDYPYTSGAGDDSSECLYSVSKATSVEVSEFHIIVALRQKNTIKKLKAAVRQQPVSTAITVNNLYIHSYASGVVDASDCYGGQYNPINHAVLIVGYGTDETTGLDYWLFKNSWNTTWGDKGYFKLAMNNSDTEFGICGMYWIGIYPELK